MRKPRTHVVPANGWQRTQLVPMVAHARAVHLVRSRLQIDRIACLAQVFCTARMEQLVSHAHLAQFATEISLDASEFLLGRQSYPPRHHHHYHLLLRHHRHLPPVLSTNPSAAPLVTLTYVARSRVKMALYAKLAQAMHAWQTGFQSVAHALVGLRENIARTTLMSARASHVSMAATALTVCGRTSVCAPLVSKAWSVNELYK